MHPSDFVSAVAALNPFLLTAIGIGFLIFVHEVGHFAAAKWVGVRVEAFSLGFGPVLLRRTMGDTDYRLSLVPLGGYVKLAGESRESGREPKPDELMGRSVGERALIFGAGVVMNFIFAFAMFIVAFRIGVSFPAATVGGIEPGSPAWVAGLQTGDRIVAINGQPDPDFEELVYTVALDSGAKGTALTVERDGRRLDFRVRPKYDPAFGIRHLGIEKGVTLRVGAILAFSDKEVPPAVRAGIRVGDRLLAVDGKRLKDWQEFRALCLANPGKPLAVQLEREGKEVSVTLVPRRVVPIQIGVSGQSSTVSAVRRGSVAEQMGIAGGDRVVSVNGTPVSSWMRFSTLLAEAKKPPIRIELGRGNVSRTMSLDDTSDSAKDGFFEGMAVRPGLVVAEVVEGAPAAKAGIKPGDTLLTLGGKRLRTWEEFASGVREAKGGAVRLTWERSGKPFGPVEITPLPNEKAALGEVGLAPTEDRVLRQYGFWKSCTVGSHKAVINVVRLYYTLTGFASGNISPRNIGSIIIIAQAAYQSALEGLGRLLYFLGFLGIQLAVLNILPIPILDGGHLLFLIFEKIKGSPVKERTMAIAQYAGLAVLLSLILYAVRNDLWRILGWS